MEFSRDQWNIGRGLFWLVVCLCAWVVFLVLTIDAEPQVLYRGLSAGGLAVTFQGPGRWTVLAMRERRRAKRGECRDCGYPRGDAAVCPECGKNDAE